MIVRGSVLSEKRVSLESALPERAAVAAIRGVTSLSREEQFIADAAETAPPGPVLATAPGPASVSTYAPAPGPASTYAPAHAQASTYAPAPTLRPVAPEPPPITFEVVAKWLATQSDATRTRLASLVAAEVEQIRHAAQEEGWQKGHDAGRAGAEAESNGCLSVLAEINRLARATLEKESAELAEECAEIVAVAFTRIAGARLVTQKAALGVVSEILKRVTDERKLIVRVSATDLPALQELKEKLTTAVAGRSLSLVADPRVQLGGAIVESKLGSLDGRLEVQLRALFDTLQAAKSIKEAS